MEILLYQIPIKLSSPRQQFNPNVNRSAEFSEYYNREMISEQVTKIQSHQVEN